MAQCAWCWARKRGLTVVSLRTLTRTRDSIVSASTSCLVGLEGGSGGSAPQADLSLSPAGSRCLDPPASAKVQGDWLPARLRDPPADRQPHAGCAARVSVSMTLVVNWGRGAWAGSARWLSPAHRHPSEARAVGFSRTPSGTMPQYHTWPSYADFVGPYA